MVRRLPFFFFKCFFGQASLINRGGSAAFQRRTLSPCVQSSMRYGPLDVPALELLPCAETSVTSVFLPREQKWQVR